MASRRERDREVKELTSQLRGRLAEIEYLRSQVALFKQKEQTALLVLRNVIRAQEDVHRIYPTADQIERSERELRTAKQFLDVRAAGADPRSPLGEENKNGNQDNQDR